MADIQQADVVGNYLQAYTGAQDRVAKQQDAQYQRQRQMTQDGQQSKLFDMNLSNAQIEHGLKAAELKLKLLGGVQPGDVQGLEAAKAQYAQFANVPIESLAGVTIDKIPALREQGGQELAHLKVLAEKAGIRAQDANTAQSYAAAAKDRAAANAVGSGKIDPTTGQPIVKLTEGQAKDLSYYRRGVASNNKLDDARSKEMMSGWNSTFADAPVIGNAWLSPSARQGQQAAKDFIAAILRRDTGAAVSDSEFNYYASFLLPQYGDDADTLAQKKESRAQALESIRAGLGTAEILAKIGPQPTDQNAPPPPAGAGGATGEAKVFKYDANGNRVQ